MPEVFRPVQLWYRREVQLYVTHSVQLFYSSQTQRKSEKYFDIFELNIADNLNPNVIFE